MKNPIYSIDNTYTVLINKYIENKDSVLSRLVFNPQTLGLQKFLEVSSQIVNDGSNIIVANKEDFSSQISRDTIKKLTFKDLRFPLKSSSITLNDSNSISKIFYSIEGNKLTYCVEDNGIISTTIYFEDDMEIGNDETINNLENTDNFYDVVSVLMYLSMYRDDKSRVNITKAKQSPNKKKMIKKGICNVIKISVDTKYSTVSEKSNRKSNKLWIVRGHWRKQPTKIGSKLIWIDQFWKGSGSEKIQKVYKG